MNQRGVRAIVTTHHGALKIFAHNTPGVENGSMVFDSETLQPTYEFRLGVPGASYALEIAARIGLDPQVVDEARQRMGSEKGQLESLISDLEHKIQKQEEIIRHLKLEEVRLNGLIKLYQQRAEELATHKRKLKQQAIEESEAILARANAAVEQAIKEIREKQAAREAIQASKARLQQEKQALEKERKKIKQPVPSKVPKQREKISPEEIAPGVTVWWRSQHTQATVIDRPDADHRVYLQAGPLRVRVPLDELEVVSAPPKKSAGGSVTVIGSGPVPQQVDVRGMRVEEALARVEQYLSEAILYGWEEVRIIHGKGTGALRKAITEMLRAHPNVAGFEPAPVGMGDLGVTVVKFK
ncbi:MAG: hypothetical protein D6814_01260 [Calditrichaeota bacterium]|nr:MAG: hypothetical protein D6814_01260 [Calditrichota bacterium]